MNLQHNISVIVHRTFLIFAVIIMIVSYFFLGKLFTPVWYEWNNFNTTHGFYQEPRDSIEALFIGSSYIVSGITPIELYEDYGICAYNLGTEQQALNVSYYWLQETYRLHSESLTTVVLDVSMLRHMAEEEFFLKGINAMKLYPNKIKAIFDYYTGKYGTGDYKDALNQLNPVTAFHERWDSLSRQDFEKFHRKPDCSTRGYYFSLQSTTQNTHTEEDNLLISLEQKSRHLDVDAPGTVFDDEPLYYFQNIIDFCSLNNLQLILIKTPNSDWGSSDHNAVQALAAKYGLTFLDYNFGPLYDQLESRLSEITIDGNHLNYWGASKLTNILGHYMTVTCNINDVRYQEKYSYMDQQLEEYNRSVSFQIEMESLDELYEYISLAKKNENCYVFLTAQDEASSALTESYRMILSHLGLTQLSEINFRDSYVAVINGNLIYENLQDASEMSAITYHDCLPNNVSYTLSSAGMDSGNYSSCRIDSIEYSEKRRGLNAVIYDLNKQSVIDCSNFDLYQSTKRSNTES